MNSKKEYEHVIGVVRHNTTPKQPPMIHEKHVKTIACGYIGIEPDAVESKLTRAVQNGELIRDGKRYVTTDDDRVARAIQHVVNEVPVNQTLLGKLNTAKMQS